LDSLIPDATTSDKEGVKEGNAPYFKRCTISKTKGRRKKHEGTPGDAGRGGAKRTRQACHKIDVEKKVCPRIPRLIFLGTVGEGSIELVYGWRETQRIEKKEDLQGGRTTGLGKKIKREQTDVRTKERSEKDIFN